MVPKHVIWNVILRLTQDEILVSMLVVQGQCGSYSNQSGNDLSLPTFDIPSGEIE